MEGANVEFLPVVAAGAAEVKAMMPARVAVNLIMGCCA
jgi:hypothetical protein